MKYIDNSKGSPKTSLMESNDAEMKHVQTQAAKLVEQTAKEYGITKPEEIFDFVRRGFSVAKFREGAYGLHKRMNLIEAQSELTFGQLLRAGIQNTFNDIYQAVPVTYTAAVKEVSSNKRQEYYAPLERAGFPKRVERGASFPETDFKGLDIELVNVKYGNMMAVERELVDDDMTGQVVQRAQQMGENARIHEEAYVWSRLMNSTGLALDGEPLPVSATYANPYVAGVVGTSGGIHGNGRGVNALSPGRLSQTQIENAWKLSQAMLDQSGRPMLVNLDLLAISPQDYFFAEVLMGSATNPSATSSASVDKGSVGSVMSSNPIKNLVGIVCSRFIQNYGALMMQSGKGFVMQRRDAQEMVQENPQSGSAFSQEVFRYKNRSRWEADFIDPKFIINMNSSFSAT